MVSHASKRKVIIQRIKNNIFNAYQLNNPITKEQIIAALSIEYGTARRKANEYINNLLVLREIKEEWNKNNCYLIPFVNQEIEL